MRFPMDVLAAVRKRVGDDFIVGFRYTADEAQKGGINAADGLEISKRLAATGQLDFLNVVRGRIRALVSQLRTRKAGHPRGGGGQGAARNKKELAKTQARQKEA